MEQHSLEDIESCSLDEAYRNPGIILFVECIALHPSYVTG